ncbi:MAG TPA: sialidase family protein, partial [Opitutaceae bacterium]|nr:sialidase family protein [Opitutaceae bacterium]
TGDPALAYGPDGTAYYAALAQRGHPLEKIPAKQAHAWDGRVSIIWRMPPGATRWESPVTLRFADREYIVVDSTKGKNHGRVYMTGDPRPKAGFVVLTSTDGGRTYNDPGAEAEAGGGSIGNAVIAADGTLIGVYATPDTLRVARSTDGGATFQPSIAVDKFVRAGGRKDARANNVNHFLHMAIDGSSGAFKDRVYIAWPDRRNGRSQVHFTYSTDKGVTWAPSRVVTDNPASDQNDTFMPTVAVNKDGVLGLLWYDRRDNPDNRSYYARFSASLDGGTSWLPSVRVSTAQFGAGEVAKKSAFAGNGGDTAGLAPAADGSFHPVWIADVKDVPQMFTARIDVKR